MPAAVPVSPAVSDPLPVAALPRIAYVTALYPAASHTFILREVSALRDLGFEVLTCSVRRPPEAQLIGPEERAAAADTFFIVPEARSPVAVLGALGAALAAPGRLWRTLCLARRTAQPGLRGALKQFAYLAEAMLLSRHLRAAGVAQMHCHFASAVAHVTLLASELSGLPFSYTLHGPSDLYEPHSWKLKEKTAGARFVACISHFARSQAMLFSDPADWPKLRIVHCGVVPERYETDPDKAVAKARDGGLDMVFVGRLAPVKGLRVLLGAMQALRESCPGLTLTIVGDGEDRAHLEALAAPLGEAVRFLGYRSQAGVAEAVAAADALVLPSFAEGLPVVLMEALAAGKPVIATRVAGVAELVEDGVSGYIVAPGDGVALAGAIRTLAATPPEVRARMGATGRDRVRAEFDVRIEAARIGALFAGTGGSDPRPEPLDVSR